MKFAAFLSLFIALPPLRAAQFEARPAETPVVSFHAPAAGLLWTAAGLPALEPAAWDKLQIADAAALHAGAVLTERLAQDPSYKGTLTASLAAHADAAALTQVIAALAARGADADPLRRAAARQAVAAAAPQALNASAKADLSSLSEKLAALRASGSVLEALSNLGEAFDLARGKPDAALPVAGSQSAGTSALARATPHEASREPAPPAAAPVKKKKALGLLDLVALGVNSIIGAGIFIKPATMAGVAGKASIFAFPITALLLIPVALSFAEAGTYFHGKDGGAYQYTRGAFPEKGFGKKAGEWASFSVTWMAWVALLFGWAAVTSVIAMNLAYFVPALAHPWFGKGLAAISIAVISYINYRGVKEGAAVSNAFALAKLLPMLAFIAVGLTMLHPVAFAGATTTTLVALGSASFMAFFALQGFENIAVPGGEVHEPAKNIPRAVIISLLLASLIYGGIQVVSVGLTPGLAGSTKPVVDAAFQIMGAVGAGVMALCAFFSTTGDSAAAALFGARFIKVLADDDHIPGSAQIKKIHPRFGTPHAAILLTSGLTIASLLLPLDTLMDVSSIAVAGQYIGTCLAIPFLRRRHAAEPGAFRLPGGPLIPILGALSAIALSVAGGFGSLTIDFALLSVGLALKFAWGLRQRPA